MVVVTDLMSEQAKDEARHKLLEKFLAEENTEDCVQLFHFAAADRPSKVPDLCIGRSLKELADLTEESDVIEALDNCDFTHRYWAVLNLENYTIESYDYDGIVPLIGRYSWEIADRLKDNCGMLLSSSFSKVPKSITKLCEEFEKIEYGDEQ